MSDLLFMKMSGDNFKGQEPIGADQEAIRITSYSHGLTVPVAPGRVSGETALRRAPCEHQLFSVTKEFDFTSSKLFAACANGVVFKSVVIYLCMSDEQKGPMADGHKPTPFLWIVLNDVIIADFSYGYSSDWPQESLGLKYISIGWRMKWNDPVEGTSSNIGEMGWDGKTNSYGMIPAKNVEWK